jgi:hypothetical protein
MRQFWSGGQLSEQDDFQRAVNLVANAYVHPLVAIGNSVPDAFYALTFCVLCVGVAAVAASGGLEMRAFTAATFLLPIIAAAVGKWGLITRLMMFAVPVMAMVAGVGAFTIASLIPIPRLRQTAFALTTVLILLYPAKAGLYIVRHPEYHSPREGVRFVLQQFREGDVLYLYSRAVPAWIFYSSDWKSHERERRQWLQQASAATGPNAGNIPSRRTAVVNEGAKLKRPYRGGWEVVGVGEGIFRSIRGPAAGGPDPGWEENEFRRVAALAPRRVIVVGLSAGARGVPDLLEYFRSAGARVAAEYTGAFTRAAVFEMPDKPIAPDQARDLRAMRP